MTNKRSRQPKGTSSGGEFASNERDEAADGHRISMHLEPELSALRAYVRKGRS